MNYIHNDILKPFKVKIIRYAEHVRDMHDLAKYLLRPLVKGRSAEEDNWTFRNQELTASDFWLAIKYVLPAYMQDEL